MTAYIYTPVVWESKGLDESELNLPSLAVESHLIDGSSAQSEFEASVISNPLENSDNAGIQGLIIDVHDDVHNRTSCNLFATRF